MKQKGLRKLLGMVLAVVMVLSMSITGFAYSIEIDPANEGETYKIYKLFDATYDSSGNVAYTIDTSTIKGVAWYQLVNATGSPFKVTQTTISGVYNVTKESSTDAATIVSWLSGKTLPTYDYEDTADSSGTLTINVDDPGYYYITTTTGSLVILDSAAPNVTVGDKNGTPNVDKKVQEDEDSSYGDTSDADVNQEVTFQTTISDIAGASNLILHDEMTNLSFTEVTSVIYYSSSTASGETLRLNSDYEVVTSSITDNCNFEIDFTNSFESNTLKGLSENSRAYIVVNYTATLTSGAVSSSGENKTKVTYGENNTSSQEDTTNTYTYSFKVYKYTENNNVKTPLEGAKFILSKVESGTTKYAKFDSGILTGWTSDKDSATTLESGSDGYINIAGLDADTYTLTETEAPKGYNLLENSIEVVITGTGSGSSTITQDGTSVSDATVNVNNNAGSLLPSTGGIGTTIFYIVGGILVFGAAVLFVTKKRLGNDN